MTGRWFDFGFVSLILSLLGFGFFSTVPALLAYPLSFLIAAAVGWLCFCFNSRLSGRR